MDDFQDGPFHKQAPGFWRGPKGKIAIDCTAGVSQGSLHQAPFASLQMPGLILSPDSCRLLPPGTLLQGHCVSSELEGPRCTLSHVGSLLVEWVDERNMMGPKITWTACVM